MMALFAVNAQLPQLYSILSMSEGIRSDRSESICESSSTVLSSLQIRKSSSMLRSCVASCCLGGAWGA